jgi:hypothetical protein
MEYKRNCPECNREIIYKTKYSLQVAIKHNNKCKNCANKIKKKNKEVKFIRQCPICNRDIKYFEECTYINAINNISKCKSCISKISQNRPEQKEKLRQASSGKNNPRYGSNIYTEWVEKYGQDIADIKWKERYEKHSKNMLGQNNPMYNKCPYDIWLEKYGQEIADKKLIEWKKKIARPGELNGMYGKPSPIGSGNGWSGHYKGYYFRSLLELSYLKYLLDNNIEFENAEKKQYTIIYEINNSKKTYRPDYYLPKTNQIIEIKPKKLITSYTNKCKFKAAKEYWKDKFKILTENEIQIIDLEILYTLYLNKDIIFDKGYAGKLEEYYLKHKGEINNAT